MDSWNRKPHLFLLAFFTTVCILIVLSKDIQVRYNSFQSDCVKVTVCASLTRKPCGISAGILVFNSRSPSHLVILLLLSGQVETNPGPSTNTSQPDHPCAICQDKVLDSDAALLCDGCGYWCHISCVGISTSSYQYLASKSRSFSWICAKCGSSNVGSGTSLQGLDFTHSNSFSPLSSSQFETIDVDSSIPEPTFPLTSTPTSSPTGQNHPRFSPNSPHPPRSRKRGIKAMVINCNGLKSASKQANFRATIAQHKPDVIFGCESKLDSDCSTYSIFPSNYMVFRKDRDKHGGGVFLAIDNSLTVSACPDFDVDSELQWCSIQLANSKPLFLCSYYCPPNNRAASLAGLHDSLSKLMSKHRRRQPIIVVAGDFNHPNINWDLQSTTDPASAASHQRLLDILLQFSLFQTVRDVTRPASDNILDLVVTTNPALVLDLCIHPGISDHNIPIFTLSTSARVQIKPPRKIYQFQKADIEHLKKAAEEFSTEFLQSNPENRSVEANWNMISTFLNKCLSDFVPSKMTKSRRHLPWITPTIKRQMRKRDRLFKKARRICTTVAWETYRHFRNQVAKTVHKAHSDYINTIIGASLTENPKRFWSYIKSCRTESVGIPSLCWKSKLCATPMDKAESLNEFFQSVFTREDDHIPQKGPSPFPTIEKLQIHISGVEKQLLNLNPSKASGPDETPPRLLKIIAHEIAPALTFLFQQSYNIGVVPSQWKQALVTSIHKSGDKSNPSNYRPISLTCISCKVMEHIMLSHISKHIAANNILTDAQHGFRQGLSTTTQLTSAIHDWSQTLQNRSQCDAVFLDFQKAFDRVPHDRLCTKLQYYGISGNSLNWIHAFLTGRTQAVVVDGSRSSWRAVSSGVPQGSVIGPTLFLLFINDIQDGISSPIRLFADDCVIYREILSETDYNSLQGDLQALASWSSTWLMKFNVQKCGIMSFTRKRNPVIYQYHLQNNVVPRVLEYKYLGVTLTPDLRWNTHCQNIRQKASKTLGLIRRTLSPCSKKVKSTAYTALVRPQLEYASEAWNPYTLTAINRLEQVQRAAARFVACDYRWSTSSSHLVSAHGWDTLHHRRLLDQCSLFYKIHYGVVNIPMPPTLTPATYHARNDHDLKFAIPRSSIDAFKYSFFPRTVWMWNHLPGNVVHANGFPTFKEAALPFIRTLQPPAGSRIL